MEVTQAPYGRFERVDYTTVTGSTNTDLANSARSEPSRARVLCTDEQTAGRGRRDRRWDMAPGGGLLVSFYVPWAHHETAHALPTALGVAAITAIAEFGRTVGLKWPNDIVAPDDRKVGGMLSEAVSIDGTFVGVVVGLGCNTSWPDVAVPGLESAANLDELGEGLIDRALLLAAITRTFDGELSALEGHGVGGLHDRYRNICVTIGRRVRVEQGTGAVVGMATDIDQDGALILDVQGAQRRIDVGDVVHLRPADPLAD